MSIAEEITQMTPRRNRRGLVVFLRHGEREPVPPHEFSSHDAPLTDNGRRAAYAMGRLLSARLGSIRSSPVPRCMDTARAILEGAERVIAPLPDQLLGDPGAFVVDSDLAMSELVTRGFFAAASDLGNGLRIPGFEHPDTGARRLLALALSLLADEPASVHLCVTHDLVLSTLIARMRGRALYANEWPGYLCGVVIWGEYPRLFASYNCEPFPIPNRLIPRGSAGTGEDQASI